MLLAMSESPRQEADESSHPANKEFSECPTCGRDDFKSDNGIRQHHVRTHGESLTYVELECEVCGGKYEKRRSKARGSKYCSNDCKMEAVWEKRRGRNTVTVSCDNCGEDMERYPKKIEPRDNLFCSHSCHGEWLTGENHHNWKGGKVTVECCVCGDEKKVFPAYAEKQDRHFCYEKGCRYEWISENLSGENNANWKGGCSRGYLGGWGTVRKEVRKRDNHECQCCGISQEEYIEKTGVKLDVHHIIPIRMFDSEQDAHDKQNLVTACRSCHAKWEGIPVFPDNRNK